MHKSDWSRRAAKRRKIRWGRVIFFILLPLFVVSYFGVSIYSQYHYRPQPLESVNINKFEHVPLRENQINILILGIGGSKENDASRPPDALIVAGIDFDNNNLKILSIPRDTRIIIADRAEKINHAYALGGIRLMKETLEDFLGAPLHHHFIIDCQTFIKIIDAMGGIDLYVEEDMKYQDTFAGLNINLKKGFQHLTGEKSAHYVRFRSDEMGDVGRILRQQKFLKEFLKENTRFNSLFKLPRLPEIFKHSVHTDIPPFIALKAANFFRTLDMNTVKTDIVPGYSIDSNYWEPDKEQTRRLAESIFYQ